MDHFHIRFPYYGEGGPPPIITSRMRETFHRLKRSPLYSSALGLAPEELRYRIRASILTLGEAHALYLTLHTYDYWRDIDLYSMIYLVFPGKDLPEIAILNEEEAYSRLQVLDVHRLQIIKASSNLWLVFLTEDQACEQYMRTHND